MEEKKKHSTYTKVGLTITTKYKSIKIHIGSALIEKIAVPRYSASPDVSTDALSPRELPISNSSPQFTACKASLAGLLVRKTKIIISFKRVAQS